MMTVRSASRPPGARVRELGQLGEHVGHLVAALAAADVDDHVGVAPLGDLLQQHGLAGAEAARARRRCCRGRPGRAASSTRWPVSSGSPRREPLRARAAARRTGQLTSPARPATADDRGHGSSVGRRCPASARATRRVRGRPAAPARGTPALPAPGTVPSTLPAVTVVARARTAGCQAQVLGVRRGWSAPGTSQVGARTAAAAARRRRRRAAAGRAGRTAGRPSARDRVARRPGRRCTRRPGR